MSTKNEDLQNYVIFNWMVSKLGLKGNELMIYAIIYEFSQEEGQRFTGSLQYLASWTNSTKQGVMKCLKSLVSKDLIKKTEKLINGVKWCEYYAIANTNNQSEDFKGVWIPREIWLDKRLTATEKNIFAEILNFATSEEGYCKSDKHIARICQCSEARVSAIIAKLIELGYLYEESFDDTQRILKTKLRKNEEE